MDSIGSVLSLIVAFLAGLSLGYLIGFVYAPKEPPDA